MKVQMEMVQKKVMLRLWSSLPPRLYITSIGLSGYYLLHRNPDYTIKLNKVHFEDFQKTTQNVSTYNGIIRGALMNLGTENSFTR